MNNKEIYKLIKHNYKHLVYRKYEIYLYNKGWIDCLEQLKVNINIKNCHTLNISLGE